MENVASGRSGSGRVASGRFHTQVCRRVSTKGPASPPPPQNSSLIVGAARRQHVSGLKLLLSLASCRAFSGPTAESPRLGIDSTSGACLNGPCGPGNEVCGQPFGKDAPQYHLMDQNGCAENDPNGPVFDPVHGVIHHFYQIHLAAPPGHGPNYGHFVSKDFVHWAPLPVAIWNGLDSSVWPPRFTPYDNEAIFTGSAVVVDGAGPGGKGPGVVNIYPGLCNKNDWPGCETGTLLAQAVPANYANDPLLTNWTKPSYNPIVENTQRSWLETALALDDGSSPSGRTAFMRAQGAPPHSGAQPRSLRSLGARRSALARAPSKLRILRVRTHRQRDPSSPWRLPSGEWRLRTFDSKVYGTASDADLLSGKWYEIGTSRDLRKCDGPSSFLLPAATSPCNPLCQRLPVDATERSPTC